MAVKYKGMGYVSVPSAGTPVVLSATEIWTPGVLIEAAATNVGIVYVGGDDLDANTRGVELSPGAALEIIGPNIGGIEEEFSLSEIKVDAANNNDKVVVSYFVRRS